MVKITHISFDRIATLCGLPLTAKPPVKATTHAIRNTCDSCAQQVNGNLPSTEA